MGGGEEGIMPGAGDDGRAAHRDRSLKQVIGSDGMDCLLFLVISPCRFVTLLSMPTELRVH